MSGTPSGRSGERGRLGEVRGHWRLEEMVRLGHVFECYRERGFDDSKVTEFRVTRQVS